MSGVYLASTGQQEWNSLSEFYGYVDKNGQEYTTEQLSQLLHELFDLLQSKGPAHKQLPRSIHEQLDWRFVGPLSHGGKEWSLEYQKIIQKLQPHQQDIEKLYGTAEERQKRLQQIVTKSVSYFLRQKETGKEDDKSVNLIFNQYFLDIKAIAKSRGLSLTMSKEALATGIKDGGDDIPQKMTFKLLEQLFFRQSRGGSPGLINVPKNIRGLLMGEAKKIATYLEDLGLKSVGQEVIADTIDSYMKKISYSLKKNKLLSMIYWNYVDAKTHNVRDNNESKEALTNKLSGLVTKQQLIDNYELQEEECEMIIQAINDRHGTALTL